MSGQFIDWFQRIGVSVRIWEVLQSSGLRSRNVLSVGKVSWVVLSTIESEVSQSLASS